MVRRQPVTDSEPEDFEIGPTSEEFMKLFVEWFRKNQPEVRSSPSVAPKSSSGKAD